MKVLALDSNRAEVKEASSWERRFYMPTPMPVSNALHI